MVTVYTRTSCPPCRTVKYFLNKKGIPFIEKDIDDPANSAEFGRLTNTQMVPLIIVGDQKIQGLNLSLLSEALMV